MTPKRAGFFWAGRSMSWLRYMTLFSFRQLNPEWEMVLYQGEAPSETSRWLSTPEQRRMHEQHAGPDYWGHVEGLRIKIQPWIPYHPVSRATYPDLPPAMQSDLAGWSFLAEGGVWIDMDILFAKPLAVIGQILDSLDIGLCTWNQQYVLIGLLASSGRSPFFRDVWIEATRFELEYYQSAGAEAVYRVVGYPGLEAARKQSHLFPLFLRNLWRRLSPIPPIERAIQWLYPDSKVVVIPQAAVYPWESTQLESMFLDRMSLPAGSIGIHWFGGMRLAQWFSQRMGPDNLDLFDNTLASVARQLLPGQAGICPASAS